ncbi:MAG TPA: Clp protease N-terminal domain-containing protein, partial [Vicinamibacterales bacterium]|nr:Clp protease N-terminal domain-containing protein [Vicinamibacterales bacterium]
MFERYTEIARRSLFFARYEASQLGSTSIAPEHLLLGLIRERHGIIENLLTLCGVSGDLDFEMR